MHDCSCLNFPKIVLINASLFYVLSGPNYTHDTNSVLLQLWCQAPFCYAVALICGGLFFARKMRNMKYVTMLDPLQVKYGKPLGALFYIPAFSGEVIKKLKAHYAKNFAKCFWTKVKCYCYYRFTLGASFILHASVLEFSIRRIFTV